jgi:hypothetical protein
MVKDLVRVHVHVPGLVDDPRDNVNTVAMTDVYYHVDEADHMVRMLLPERQFTRAMVARAL